MSNPRFVSEHYLLPKLPAFIKTEVNNAQLDRLVDLIEEELILKKAEEIKERRKNEVL
jgi:hypothetical protein